MTLGGWKSTRYSAPSPDVAFLADGTARRIPNSKCVKFSQTRCHLPFGSAVFSEVLFELLSPFRPRLQ